MARIIDGKFLAAKLRARVADEVTRVQREERLTPGLAVILVGDVPASQIYVRSKIKTCGELGIFSERLTPLPPLSLTVAPLRLTAVAASDGVFCPDATV